MKIVAIMPVRNEDWCLGLTARALLMWCDELVIGLHACTDESADIAAQVRAETKRVCIQIQPDVGEWREMANRQALLEVARKRGATHVITIDADEVVTGDLLTDIRQIVGDLQPGRTLNLRWLCMPTLDTYFATGIWGDNWADCGFVDLPHLHWAARDGYDFHHRRPMGQQLVPVRRGTDGGLMHLQFADRRRLRAKQFLYTLTERLRWPDREPAAKMVQRYSQAIYTDNEARASVKEGWWEPYADLMQHLHLGCGSGSCVICRDPWQLDACKRILRGNPGIGKGLDDFGLGLI